jgi:hypothetical protein
MLGFDPQLIILSHTNKQFQNLLPLNDNLSNSISNYYGYLGNHYPTGKLWDFLKRTPFINTTVKLNLISHVSVYYIDGSSSGKGGIHVKGIGGLSGPQPPCWRNQYQTPHVDKISNAAGRG